MEIEFISISNIFVNPNNPRHNPTLDDITAINVLINEDVSDMLNLAKSINSEGFFPQKVVSLIEKNQKLVAIDGNRRIAAIKCLLEPEYIQNQKYKEKFKQIQLDKVNPDMRIPCVKYDNVLKAVPFILTEHTEGGQTKKWTRIQQCYFMLDYGTRAEVPECFLLYYDNFSREYNSKIENFSTIERFLKKEEVDTLLKLDKDILLKVLQRFVEDTNNSGEYTSRNLNTAAQQKEYFDRVLLLYLQKSTTEIEDNKDSQVNIENQEKKDLSATSTTGAADISNITLTSGNPQSFQTPTANVKATTVRHAFTKLTWSGLDKNNPMTRSIIEISKEIKALAKKYNDFPIATTVLIRSLLEIALKYWLTKKYPAIYNKIVKNSRGLTKDPQLSDIIAEINNQINNKNTIFDLHIDDGFKTYFSKNDKTMKDRMDILIHRPWDLGTNSQLYKLYEDDFIYTCINFILNNK